MIESAFLKLFRRRLIKNYYVLIETGHNNCNTNVADKFISRHVCMYSIALGRDNGSELANFVSLNMMPSRSTVCAVIKYKLANKNINVYKPINDSIDADILLEGKTITNHLTYNVVSDDVSINGTIEVEERISLISKGQYESYKEIMMFETKILDEYY